MRKGTPEQFIAELQNKISELKYSDIAESARVIVDEEDVIEADSDIDMIEDVASEVSSLPIDSYENDEDSNEYINNLYSSVEDELNDMVQGVSWSSDEENIYMDVSFADDHVITFTIPKEDLMFDLASIDKDVNYICTAVRESNPSEPDEEELPSAEEPGVQMELDSEPPVYM